MPRQTKVILRNGTYAEWVAANPVLGDREIVFENDSNLIKVGDGSKRYLDYIYAANFGVTGWSPDWNSYQPQYPSNYSTTNATAPTALSYSTTSRAMHLVPFSYYEGNFHFENISISQGSSGIVGKVAFYIYNSDEYGRPKSLVSSNYVDAIDPYTGVAGVLAGANLVTTFLIQTDAGMTSSGTYWIGVCVHNVTTAGSILTYIGNDTYINPTTSSGTIASTTHYSCYIVNIPYSATSMNYTIQNGSKAFTIANTTFTGTNLSLSGSYAVHGGFAVGDNVYVYADSDNTNYAEGTISALTTTTITVNFTGNTNWDGTLTANTKNLIVLKSPTSGNYMGNGYDVSPPFVPETLTTSHLMPSTGNAPIVRSSL